MLLLLLLLQDGTASTENLLENKWMQMENKLFDAFVLVEDLKTQVETLADVNTHLKMQIDANTAFRIHHTPRPHDRAPNPTDKPNENPDPKGFQGGPNFIADRFVSGSGQVWG